MQAWFELAVEIVRREVFYSTYLALVAAAFAYIGVRGLTAGETRGFGWGSGPALAREAVVAGRVWLALGAALGTLALFFKLT